MEGIESSAELVARYAIVEKYYLQYETEAAPGLQKAIGNLYANILTYLARVKKYFTGGTLSKCSIAFHQWRLKLVYIQVFTHICLKNVSVGRFSKRCETITQSCGKRFQRLESNDGPGWLKKSVSMLVYQSHEPRLTESKFTRERENMLPNRIKCSKIPLLNLKPLLCR